MMVWCLQAQRLTVQQQAAHSAAGQHLRCNAAHSANAHNSNLRRQRSSSVHKDKGIKQKSKRERYRYIDGYMCTAYAAGTQQPAQYNMQLQPQTNQCTAKMFGVQLYHCQADALFGTVNSAHATNSHHSNLQRQQQPAQQATWTQRQGITLSRTLLP
jgi:hypothetical protein